MLKQNIAYVAQLIGDSARAEILIALLQGRALTAGELARQADISPQTASSHLNKLVEGSLVTVAAQGRHRYYQLASAEVAHTLEALALLSPQSTHTMTAKPLKEIQYARSCYDHLAGRLGVLLTQALIKQKLIRQVSTEYELTAKGSKCFMELGIDVTSLMTKRRRFAYPCLDWSERIHHLAGSLGASILELLISKRWILRAKAGRVIHVTPQGKLRLNELFNIEL